MREIENIVKKYGDITALMHYVNVKTLKKEHERQKEGKATGVDEVTKEIYSINIDERLEELITKMKKFAYKPLPVRRVYIPKSNGEKRPLGIPAYEDKLVQGVMAKCMTAVYGTEFLDCSYGFRPNRGCHDAIIELNQLIMTKKVNYILDCDIKGFFNNVNHELLIKCLEEKIKDKNFIRYIKRFLIGGIMENNMVSESIMGTPQGGLISPILANIYLHYALDLWFERKIKPTMKGECYLIRYADDFVILFQYENEARDFYNKLKQRMRQAKLELAEDKTKIIPFGRYKGTKETFDFLGFTFKNGTTKTGKYTVLKKTNKNKLKEKKQKIKKFLKDNMHLGIKETIKEVNKKLNGHYAYYGITGNYDELKDYYLYTKEMFIKTKSRRSQRSSEILDKINRVLEEIPLAKPKIYINMWT